MSMERDTGQEDFREPNLPSARQRSPRGGGGDLKMLVFVSLVVTLAVLVLMSMAGGVLFLTPKSISAQVVALEQATADLAKARSDVATAIQNLPTTVSNQVSTLVAQSVAQWTSQLASMSATLTTLSGQSSSSQGKITELETRVTELEAKLAAVEEEPASVGETSRWTFKGERITYWSGGATVPEYIEIYVDEVDPTKVEDEGLYDVVLTIWNSSDNQSWVMGNLELELILEPRDYVPINEDDTYLDSDNYPWLTWDAEFSIKTREGEDICRRITFTTDRYNFNHTMAPFEKYELELVLELYYK